MIKLKVTKFLDGSTSCRNIEDSKRLCWQVEKIHAPHKEKDDKYYLSDILMNFYALPELELYLSAFEAGANACGEFVVIERTEIVEETIFPEEDEDEQD